MPDKKGKRKKKNQSENDVVNNVDKAFYELQILDLTRKLARLRERVSELEETIAQQDTKMGKMNEDHGDIISYLKRNLTERGTEVSDLQMKVASLTEMNAAQQHAHEKRMEKCEEDFNAMREQLISKIKMLTGQLNTLEDYRMHKEELMLQFKKVHHEMDEQELNFRKQLYEIEKKTIVGKDNLKREMEEKLFGLASNFQKSNQIRMAATSQRIVRENIALNNDMNTLIAATNDLDHENFLMKQQFMKTVADYRLLEEAHKISVYNSSLQKGVIKELTATNLNQKFVIGKYEESYQENIEDKRKLKDLLLNEQVFHNKIKQLENRLNAARYSQRDMYSQLYTENYFRRSLETIVQNIRLLVKSTLINYPELQAKVEIPNEKNIFIEIIEMARFSKSEIIPPSPYNSVSSVSIVHPLSDYGADHDEPIVEMKPPAQKINVSTYLGASFEDFLRQQVAKPESRSDILEDLYSDMYMLSESTITKLTTGSEYTSSTSSVLAGNDLSSKHSKCKSDEIQEEIMQEEIEEEGDMDEENMDENKRSERKLGKEKEDEQNLDQEIEEA